jgi:hypothetical protein
MRTAVAYGPTPDASPEELEVTVVVDAEAGLAGALEPISAGLADTLFVSRLASVAGSFGELIRAPGTRVSTTIRRGTTLSAFD